MTLRWFTRRWLLYSVSAAALLTATGLGVGFVGDDWYHLIILLGHRTTAVDESMFTFATGQREVLQKFIETGPYPWWSLDELKVVFLRPLSSALHRLDFTLFGMNAVPWHLHAMLWYLAMVVLWGLIARRVLSLPIAMFATLLFAIDDVHWMPAVWLANRNALVACVPALFGLYAHIRWRQDRWLPGLPLSILGYVVAMFGGEAWLGIAAYVLAYESVGRAEPVSLRIRAVLPAAGCAVAYAIAYKLTGHGVHGSAVYVEPLSSDYFRQVPGRLLALIGAYLVSSPVDAWAFLDAGRIALIAVGAIVVAVTAWLLRRAWPSLADDDRLALRWLIAGALLSLLPVAAAFPMNRLLLAASIGGSAVVAVIIRHWWVHRRTRPARAAGYVTALLAVIHLILAPMLWPVQSGIVSYIGYWARNAYLDAPIDPAREAQQHIYLIADNDLIGLMYPAILRHFAGHDLPASWHTLSTSPSTHELLRVDDQTFELECADYSLQHGVFGEILRGPQFPFAPGDTVDLGESVITILATRDGKPTHIRLTFDCPLDDPSLVFLIWQDRKLKRLEFPPAGNSITLTYTSG